jgi:DNA polymerase-3 subunit beta
MKFIVSSTVLAKSLQSISGVLGTNSTLPILDNFLFELQGDELKITASDIETTMSVVLPLSKAEEDGSIAVPARILLDTLKTYGNIPLSFSINLDTKIIEISTDEGKYKLSGFDAEEFPSPPEIENPSSVKISPEALEQAINKTVFATGDDDLRPVMSGVNVEFTAEGVIFVATDAHKLVKYTRKDYKSDSEDSFIVPKKPLIQLKNILGHIEEEVLIEYNDVNAVFTFESYKLICRLVEGKYPNYEAVIPKDNPNKLVLDRYQLLNSIKRVSIFANQSTNQIRLNISGQELVLSAEDLDYTNEARERMNCNYSGDDLEIGFNSKFFIEMLNNIDTKEVELELSTPSRAGLILPVDNEDENEEITLLVMPVMLNS